MSVDDTSPRVPNRPTREQVRSAALERTPCDARAIRVYVQIDSGPVQLEGSVEWAGSREPWGVGDLRGVLEEVRFSAAEVLLWHHMCAAHGWTRDRVEAHMYEGLVEIHRQMTCLSHEGEVTAP